MSVPAIDFFTNTVDMIEPSCQEQQACFAVILPKELPNPPKTETSEELEILRVHSVDYSAKAAKIISNAIGQLKVGLDALTMLVGGARPKQSRKLH